MVYQNHIRVGYIRYRLSLFAIILLLITTSCYAENLHRSIELPIASSENPLRVRATLNNDLGQPLYVVLKIGKIHASENSAPSIRVFLDTDKLTSPPEPGIPEHLGTLAIFPWPDKPNGSLITATFNATKSITDYIAANTDKKPVNSVPFIISISPGAHSNALAKVEIISLIISSKDKI